MTNKLSEKYGFLKLYQVLLFISILIYSWFTYKGINNILELKKEMPLFKETGNEMITNSVVQYVLILFSTFCIISIVNFIFSLDENINDLEKKSTINKENSNVYQNKERTLDKKKRNEIKNVTKSENRKTKLLKNSKAESIIQGRIHKILENTIIVAHNDNDERLIEVKNYPAKNIIDEIWVRINVRYLYTTSNLVDIVEFIEHVEKY
jgi:hypothetical protein